jgi:hypothetical protein
MRKRGPKDCAKMRRLRAILLIYLVSLPIGHCAAMEISRFAGCSGGDVLKLRGEIERIM